MFRRKRPIPTDTPLGTVLASMLKHCEGLGYRGEGLEKIRSVCQTMIELADQEPRQTELSDELLGRLRAKYEIPSDEAEESLNRWQLHIGRCIRMLREFSVHGCFQRRRKVAEKTVLPSVFQERIRGYEEYALQTLRVRPRIVRRRRRSITELLHFLDSKRGPSIEGITPALLSEFVSSRIHLNPQSVATVVSDLRSFLRFLLMRGLLDKDLTGELPRIRIRPDMHIPSVWNREDVDRLLAAVDRSSPMGKRDYAILLLACRLGLRVGDIRTLRLEHLNWDEARIEIPQSKTGVPVTLPLPEEVGQALIDYLRHGRPKSNRREVFLRARAPFEPFGELDNLYHIIRFWRRRAGISVAQKRGRYGLHSLRHTLATRLLEADTPLQTIADIIGHLSVESTRRYTKADVRALRSVALDPEEVARA